MKLLKNFTWKDLEEIENSLEDDTKEKVFISLPKVPKVSLRNYKALAKDIREATTQSGISPDTWEDFLDYFNLKLKTKGKYSETTLDKAIETYLRKRLGYKITDVWQEIIEAYRSITSKPLIPPPEIQNLLMQELEIRELMKLPNVEVVIVEKSAVKQKTGSGPRSVKHTKPPKPSIKKRTRKLKVKPSKFKELIENLKAKSKKLYIFYVKDGRKIIGVLVFYEKP